MYAGWANRRAFSATVPLRRPGHQDDLRTGAFAGLQRSHALQREGAVGAAQQRAAGAEQRAVEVDVEAAHADILAHRRGARDRHVDMRA